MNSFENSMEKIPFILIEEKYSTNIKSDKVGVTRFLLPVIERTSIHTYLNIYDSQDKRKRSSCIECDDYLTFDIENCLMIYKRMNSTMVYKLFSKKDTEKVKKLFE